MDRQIRARLMPEHAREVTCKFCIHKHATKLNIGKRYERYERYEQGRFCNKYASFEDAVKMLSEPEYRRWANTTSTKKTPYGRGISLAYFCQHYKETGHEDDNAGPDTNGSCLVPPAVSYSRRGRRGTGCTDSGLDEGSQRSESTADGDDPTRHYPTKPIC